MTKISIVMPVFNRVDTIEKAIKSVLDQQDDNIELIVMDGGSTDGTADIIKQYDSSIAYWQSRKDHGAGDATNQGIERATGEIIGLLMADDWYEPGVFKALRDAMDKSPSHDIYTFGGRIVEKDKSGELQTIVNYEVPKDTELSFWNVVVNARVLLCCRFIKKTLYDRIGLFDTMARDGSQMLSNDMEFMMRAMLAQATCHDEPFLAYTHFAHEDSYSFAGNRKIVRRHCAEHMDMANLYLKRVRAWKLKLLLRYWYCDQALRYFAYCLLDKKYKAAFECFVAQVVRYNILWLGSLAVTSTRVVLKKLFT